MSCRTRARGEEQAGLTVAHWRLYFGNLLASENAQLAENQLCEIERLWALLIGL